MHYMQSRRDFLASASLAAAAGALGARSSLAEEGPPETTTLRLRRDPSICVAPWYIAEDLLLAEGFTEIRYVQVRSGAAYTQMIGRGEIDFALGDAATQVARLPACRSRRSRACMPAASSCSRTNPFAASLS